MADNDVEVRLGADASGLKAGISEASSAVKTALEGMNSSFVASIASGTALGNIIGNVVVGAVNKLSTAIKESVADTSAYYAEAAKLGRTLGVTATEAGTLMQELDNALASTEEYTSAAKGLEKQINKNEAGLNAMGLATRDVSGHLRPLNDLMNDAIGIVNKHREGTDRNITAQQLFGKGLADGTNLLKLNADAAKDAKASNDELGLTIGERGAKNASAYRDAMKDVGDVMDAIKKIIGDALMPLLTQMGAWFRSEAPAFLEKFRVLINSVTFAFELLYLAINTVYNITRAVAESIDALFMGVLRTLDKLLRGDFTGAKAEWDKGLSDIEGVVKKRMSNIVAEGQKTAEALRGLIHGDKEQSKSSAKDGSDESASTKSAKGDTRLAEWKSQLQAKKEAENDYFKSSLDMEESYWTAKLASVTGHSKEDLALRRQISSELYNIHKQQAQAERQLEDEAIAYAQKKGEAIVSTERETLQAKRQLNQITADELTAGLLDLSNREHQIQLNALQDKLKIYQNDKVQKQKILDEIALLEQKHANDVTKIYQDAAKAQIELNNQLRDQKASHLSEMQNVELQNERDAIQLKYDLGIISDEQRLDALRKLLDQEYQLQLKALQDKLALDNLSVLERQKTLDAMAVLEAKHDNDLRRNAGDLARYQQQIWKSLGNQISSLWDKGITAMMNGTLTFRNAFKAIFTQLIGWFATEVIGNYVKKWLAAQLAKLAITKAVNAEETVSTIGAQIAQQAQQKMLGITGVMSNASIAAAAAMASVAAIPLVGWEMAPEVGATTYASAMAFLPSAAGGYDIPSGVNPMTQLHEKEMVLPAKYADTIRSMADGGGSGGAINVNISAVDASGVKKLFMTHGNLLADAMKAQVRNFKVQKA